MMLEGSLAEAARKIEFGLTNDNPTDSHRRGHIWLADIYRAWNDLDRAEEHLDRAEDLAYFLDAASFFPSLEIARARLLWATGKSELAFAELALGIQRSRRTRVTSATRAAEAVRAGFWLDQGRVAEAEAWSLRAGLSPDVAPDYALLEEHIVYVRLLAANGQPNAALEILARLRQLAEEDGRVVDAGRILVREALARQAQQQHEAASNTLAEAIALLEPSGHIRCFADEGFALVALLRSVAAAGAHLDFVGELLKATGHRPQPIPEPTGGLVDPLSSRELEVLRLVSVGLSNREISDQLFISVPTVKRHISTILEKLAAHSRTQAVSVARTLQLI
jgi:LuxR family maltose regulon positive regulatory protein